MAKPKLATAPAKLAAAPVPNTDAAAEDVPPKKKTRKRLLIVLPLLLPLVAGVGGAAWFYLNRHPDEKKAEAPPVEKKTPPVFVTLEPFTVNLLQENGDHYLQVGIVYQVADDKAVDAIKTYMPVIRNRILLLLSNKHPSELAQLEGKQKLVTELVAAARDALPGAAPERGVEGAFLSAFVIQ